MWPRLRLLRHYTHLVMAVPVAVLARGTAVAGHVAAGAGFGGLAAAVPALLLQVAALWQRERERDGGRRGGVSCNQLSPEGSTYILCAGYGGRLVVQIALPARVPAHLHEELLHAQSLLCHYLRSPCLGSDHSALYLDDGLTLDLQQKEREAG